MKRKICREWNAFECGCTQTLDKPFCFMQFSLIRRVKAKSAITLKMIYIWCDENVTCIMFALKWDECQKHSMNFSWKCIILCCLEKVFKKIKKFWTKFCGENGWFLGLFGWFFETPGIVSNVFLKKFKKNVKKNKKFWKSCWQALFNVVF